MSSKRAEQLHNQSTQAVVGKNIIVENIRKLSLVVSGTSTTFALSFMVSLSGKEGEYVPIMGDKKSDYATSATSATTVGQGWEFDVENWNYFRAELTSISNGNISVYAEAFGWVD